MSIKKQVIEIRAILIEMERFSVFDRNSDFFETLEDVEQKIAQVFGSLTLLEHELLATRLNLLKVRRVIALMPKGLTENEFS